MEWQLEWSLGEKRFETVFETGNNKGSEINKTVSFSIGVATLVPDRKTFSESLISIADMSLYEGKK